MRKSFLGFTYSSLSLKPLDKKIKPRHAPFVAMLYVDTRDGSYVTLGRHVHRTLMHKKADKGVTTIMGGTK